VDVSARQCEFGIPNLPAATAENLTSYITLQARPRSADRTRSPAAVSQKREFFKCLPETIGYFAPRMANIGAQRLVANSQKPAIGGPFSERQGHFLRAPDWLAGARGFELTHSRSNPVSICPSVNLEIWASRTTRLHCTRVPAEFALYLGGSGAWPLSRRVRLHTGEKCCLKGTPFQPKCSR